LYLGTGNQELYLRMGNQELLIVHCKCPFIRS
jgi:hypothetical protein